MGSLSKVQVKEDKNGNVDWDTVLSNIQKFIGKKHQLILTPKYDGCSFEAIYENGKIKSISTRGDGTFGKDIYQHIYKKVEDAVAGLAYVVVLMSFIYKVRMLNDGLYIIPLIFICAWGNDTCAYCVGMLIGKHKMFPRLSPKKSVEGFIGGIAGAVLLGLIYGRIFGTHLISLSVPMRDCAIIAGVGALIAVVGDLAASAIKRDTGIKDYGRLIPGHGGILDRFDSILFTAPVVYILAVCLGA